jgi:hypothetical protein
VVARRLARSNGRPRGLRERAARHRRRCGRPASGRQNPHLSVDANAPGVGETTPRNFAAGLEAASRARGSAASPTHVARHAPGIDFGPDAMQSPGPLGPVLDSPAARGPRW